MAAAVMGLSCARSEQGAAARASRLGPDLASHPIYSRYQFGSDRDIIDIGIQPLWIPSNVILEAMRRDTLLAESLSELGLELRFHSFLKGADVNYFLLRGDLEVGIGGDMPALIAVAEGNALVAALIQHGFCSIVARTPTLLKALRGQRIGYAFGSNAHYALLRALSQAGLRETDVELVPMDVNLMSDALEQGTIDAFAAWEPTPFIAETQYREQVAVRRSLSTGYLYFSQSFAEGQPGAIRQIVAAQIRALGWLKTRKHLLLAAGWAGRAGEVLSGRPSRLATEDLVQLAKADLLGIASVPLIAQNDLAPDGRLFREFEFLRGLGKIGETTRWQQLRSRFDRSLVSELVSASQEHRLTTYSYRDQAGGGRGSE